ncbi:MAG: BrnT family toxin [Caldilineaceae bacterium]|nr:BrnT family toxin [Caldilineaceae bacterium]
MANFEWDENKNRENQAKHKISFEVAQSAFADRNRILTEDLAHSTLEEKRYYCIGKIGNQVCIVRFTYRTGKLESLAQATGGRQGNFMNTRINKKTLKIGAVVKGAHGDMKLIEDFLPSPADLVFKESRPKVKITLEVDSDVIAFFKEEAEKQGGRRYQPMVREVLKWYVEQQKQQKNLNATE